MNQSRIGTSRFPTFADVVSPANILRPSLILMLALFPMRSKAGVGDWTTFTFTNEVRAISFDQGDLWLATGGGVVRYQVPQNRFTTFTNTDGLSGNEVASLVVDPNRDVWIGTAGNGLSRRRFDTGSFRTFSLLDGVASDRISSLVIHDSVLWVGTSDGLSKFVWGTEPDEGRQTFVFSDAYRASRGVPVGDSNDILIAGNTLWVATETGVSSAAFDAFNLKDPVAWTTYGPGDGLPDLKVTSLAFDGNQVWAGTPNGVAFYDDVRWNSASVGLNSDEVRDLSYIGGNLWAATVAEVARFDGLSWSSVGGGVGTAGAHVIEEGHDATVWTGTASEGLGRLTAGAWEFLPSSGPAGNVVDAIFVDGDDNTWFGFNGGGVSRYDGLAWTSYDSDDGLVQGAISMIGQNLDGRMWFGSFGGGLSRLDDQETATPSDDTWETFDESNSVFEGVPEDPGFVVVNGWIRDDAGGQWFSNFGVGAQFLAGNGTFSTFRPGVASISSARIRDIAVDSASRAWFATDSRLSRYNPSRDEWTVFGTSEGLLSPQVNAVTESPLGDVWIGTDAGINRIEEGDVVTSFGLPAGLNTSRVTATRADSRGNLWVGSTAGLARFGPENFEWEVFTTANSPLSDPLVKTIAVNRPSGEVWVGTGRGVSRFESGIIPRRATQRVAPVYPNPFVPSKGDTEVVFSELADGARLSILTVDGIRVRTILPGQIVAQEARWDGRNESGQMVSGGVYFFVISAPDGSHYSGKLAVIR